MATTLVSHIPIKCSSSISTPHNKHHQAIKPCFSKPITNNHTQHLSKPTEASAFSRREAIGFGLCLNFFDTLLPASAAAESNTATTCEFTLADSGLAFCDKVVGYGSQAEKGQLIKAHYVGKLVSGKVFDSSYNRGKPLTFCISVDSFNLNDQMVKGGDMLSGSSTTAAVADATQALSKEIHDYFSSIPEIGGEWLSSL
ncbi:Peptidyl-prolyl cis-trans isomerase, FKBP-type [Artemisia annua]|uniref:peptidylprolyl isomerase n=1 Tax=Artemisia annua TaxID=35608 RepID=A0A2U1KD13_ARTAN|nr:Peptidyl-prolyl cis-trans isomerase, FKBP-type [Artemisia annua]